MENNDKIIDKIQSLQNEAFELGFSKFFVDSITWNDRPWFKLRFEINNKKGYFDISQNTFNLVENRIILKEIMRNLRL